MKLCKKSLLSGGLNGRVWCRFKSGTVSEPMLTLVLARSSIRMMIRETRQFSFSSLTNIKPTSIGLDWTKCKRQSKTSFTRRLSRDTTSLSGNNPSLTILTRIYSPKLRCVWRNSASAPRHYMIRCAAYNSSNRTKLRVKESTNRNSGKKLAKTKRNNSNSDLWKLRSSLRIRQSSWSR